MATKKSSPPGPHQTGGAAPKTSKVKKAGGKKNKLGVKNSLANNINARKKKGISRTEKDSAVSKSAYSDMENNWERPNGKPGK